jgi:hypothetical protein
MTQLETRTRKRRRTGWLVAALVLIAIGIAVHVLWFDLEWRAYLPPFIRDVMRRLYGAG